MPRQTTTAHPPTLREPHPEEHDPYYSLYIDQAPEGDILAGLADELDATRTLLDDLSPQAEVFRYQESKWSIREIVGHLIDTEWTFAYRGLFFARADPAVLPPFDQELWVRNSDPHRRPLADLLDEFAAARGASLAMFRGLRDKDWARAGIANHVAFTVRCMPYILAGHERHHRKVIRERYLR